MNCRGGANAAGGITWRLGEESCLGKPVVIVDDSQFSRVYIYFFWLLAGALCSVQVDEFGLTVYSVLVCLCMDFWSVWLSVTIYF